MLALTFSLDEIESERNGKAKDANLGTLEKSVLAVGVEALQAV